MTDSIFDITQHCVRVDLNEEISSFNFSCGDDDLDDFFHNHALLYSKEHLGKTFVFVDNDTSEIVAFFTVSNDSIKNNIHTEEFNKSGSKKNSWTQAFAYLPCSTYR